MWAMTAEDWYRKGLADLDRSLGADLWNYDADLADALESFDQAIALDHRHALAQRERGMLLARLGQHEGAMDSFIAAANLQPVDVDLQLAAARSLHALKHFERALISYDEVLRLRAEDPDAVVGRAEALTALRRDDAALVAWDEAAKILEKKRSETGDLNFDRLAQKAVEARSMVFSRLDPHPNPLPKGEGDKRK